MVRCMLDLVQSHEVIFARVHSPGRFFAASVLKVLLAVVVMNYDLKLVGGGSAPRPIYFDDNVIPDPSVQVMLRKRKSAAGAVVVERP